MRYFLLITFLCANANAQVIGNAQQAQGIHINGKSQVARAFAYAPNVVSKCSGTAAAGAQGQFAGLSFAGSYKDEFCERAELIKMATALGEDDIATLLFYDYPMVKALNKEEEESVCDYPTDECKLSKRFKWKLD